MLDDIEQRLGKLSRAEQQVGRWILAHPRQAAHAAVAEVAVAADTSQPTVIRFCRSIGVSGFRELKIRLAETIGRPASYLHRDVNQDDSTSDAAGKVLDRSIQSLIDLRSMLPGLPIESAVDLLADARQIVFVGSGASGHVACDACHKFFRLGIPCAAAKDVPTMLQLGATATARDVFVAISQSGKSSGVVHASSCARERGASVITLTAAETPLASKATLLLALPSPEDASVYTPMSSRLAQLTILDTLQVALALRLGDAAEQRLLHSKQVLSLDHVGD
ncbi:MAG: SIS domain-containing protein [Woeseia sp.]|nr:SIS domain-containing protein [Woeseia sp.]MBT8095439.1 SIS domain-containing protein [Woeseia sp.]NNE62433.1 SIS domain-containing protein [Woeseia sp.]NNL55804.1 SIS domain-containing protein [Woeseia sp.]